MFQPLCGSVLILWSDTHPGYEYLIQWKIFISQVYSAGSDREQRDELLVIQKGSTLVISDEMRLKWGNTSRTGTERGSLLDDDRSRQFIVIQRHCSFLMHILGGTPVKSDTFPLSPCNFLSDSKVRGGSVIVTLTESAVPCDQKLMYCNPGNFLSD